MSARVWQHHDGDHYGVIVRRIVGSLDHFEHESTLAGGDTWDRLGDAISVGFDHVESDDFNIGAFRDGRLVALLWMNEIVDDEPGVLLKIEREAGLVAAILGEHTRP